MVKQISNNNIVIWPSSFFPVIGGVQTVAKEIGVYIQNKKWNVTFITNRYPKTLSKSDLFKGMHIYRFHLFHSPINYIKTNRFDLLIAWILFKPVTLFKLLLHFLIIRQNVVHVHFPDNQIFEILILKKVFGFKLILSFHGNDIEKIKPINKNSLKYKLLQKLIDESSFITTCSDFVKNQVLEIFQISDNSKIMIMYNGVSDKFMNQYLVPEKDRYFFSVGRFVETKGFDLLTKVSNNFPEIEFQLGGGNKGDFINVFPKYSEQFIFLGPLKPSECLNKYRRAKITIIPSKMEPYGIVAAEALCSGSPIVATNVGGIPEVMKLAKSILSKDEILVFNNWVKLVEPNIKSLTEGINEILINESPIDDYLKLIPKIQRQFTWEKRLEDYQNSLSTLIS